MKLYYDSRNTRFKTPFGAVCCGTKIKFSFRVENDMPPEFVSLRVWDGEEREIEMKIVEGEVESFLYSAEYTAPLCPCLVWYSFYVKDKWNEWTCGNNERGLGGEGIMQSGRDCRAYQITVYEKDFKTPDWFKGKVMYQIFPDRFFRDETKPFEKRGEYIFHEDWYDELSQNMHPFENGPACNDFFGGNLSGIEKKLGYLADLGVEVIYLNPIFEAFSNHRYDTGDYKKIDSGLGDEADFERLCRSAKEFGIRIILDGVFSHTGSDSIYFNKYKTYGEGVGAWQNRESPFREWYFFKENGDYESWWGCRNLPNVDEMCRTYIDHILCGKDAIIKKWLRQGASGWRLDVADELPDEFIKILRKEAKLEKSDAVIIGEVWEDASNKESYGRKREYLLGSELDSVMNYPFKDAALGFLLGEIPGEDFSERLESLFENYPKEVIYSTMNLLGTHDTVRVKTVLGGAEKALSKSEKAKFTLPETAERIALKRLKMAAILQMTYVGSPCIYYGDEIGMQGFEDPFNRMPFNWKCADLDLLETYKALGKLRKNSDCLRLGEIKFEYAKGSLIAYSRIISDEIDVFGEKAENGFFLCVFNSSSNAQRLEFDWAEKYPKKLKGYLSETSIECFDGKIRIDIPPLSGEIYVGG